LIDAASQGDATAITALLNTGVDINTQDDKGATALMRAVEAGHTDTVKLLLDRGADVNIQGRFLGYSAIVFAVKARNADLVEMLLAACNSKPPDLNFATGVAQLSNNPRLIELLKQAATRWA
jgi:ankyrin repeat protein